MRDADIPALPLSLRPADRQYPLQDGAEVFRIKTAARSTTDVNLQFVFEVAFGEGDILQDEPLVPPLEQLVQMVQQLVELFRPLLRP